MSSFGIRVNHKFSRKRTMGRKFNAASRHHIAQCRSTLSKNLMSKQELSAVALNWSTVMLVLPTPQCHKGGFCPKDQEANVVVLNIKCSNASPSIAISEAYASSQRGEARLKGVDVALKVLVVLEPSQSNCLFRVVEKRLRKLHEVLQGFAFKGSEAEKCQRVVPRVITAIPLLGISLLFLWPDRTRRGRVPPSHSALHICSKPGAETSQPPSQASPNRDSPSLFLTRDQPKPSTSPAPAEPELEAPRPRPPSLLLLFAHLQDRGAESLSSLTANPDESPPPFSGPTETRKAETSSLAPVASHPTRLLACLWPNPSPSSLQMRRSYIATDFLLELSSYANEIMKISYYVLNWGERNIKGMNSLYAHPCVYFALSCEVFASIPTCRAPKDNPLSGGSLLEFYRRSGILLSIV
ncbi:hypothetical protein M5K25_024282 [Dendrobium thyrsiflorum]|uniref:Uncharacterized protein n=1 Tax=Dendrobium thyrsiflorum TaxID=117978 RepID=A0ABD0U1L5_DENTH